MKQTLNSLKKKTCKFLLASLAVVLALAAGFLTQFQLIGRSLDGKEQQQTPQYVGEMRIYQGKTAQDAANACKEDGFTPVEGNLNEGSGYDAVVLGYSTTEDKEEAVTDVRMMQMTSGFSTVDYADLVERQYPGLDSLLDEEYKTILEFRRKVESGSYNAKMAQQYLNMFKIPELGMKLGDYYMSSQLSMPMLKRLFLQTAAAVTTSSYNLLAAGVSDSSENNWASRVYAHRDILDVTDEDGNVDTKALEALDRQYLSNAERLVTQIQDFSTKYQNGMIRAAQNGGELPVVDPETATPEEMNEHGAEPLYIGAHAVLNQYRYDDDQLLGDWLVEMGNLTLSNKAELRNLYPLIAAMTYGQIITTQFVGFQCCAFYLYELSSVNDDFVKTLQDAKDLCLDYDNTDAISVWSGVDQRMFDQVCAVTGDAQRYTNLKDTMENIVKRNKAIRVLESVSSTLSFWTKLAGGFIVLLDLPTMAITALSYFSLISMSWCWTHGTLFMIFAFLHYASVFLGVVSLIATLVIIIIMIIVAIYDAFKPECDDLAYTSIPTVTMDLSIDGDGGSRSGLMRYDLIQGPDGKGDLNAYDGKQWNALYSSQNTDAGEPIEIVDGKAPFIVQYNDGENPAGYKAAKNFDEIYAANLNANIRAKNAPSVFLFYACKGESADTSEVKEEDLPQENAPQTVDPNEKHLYVASLFMVCEDSETIAKAKLTQQGYQVLDVNLTPHVTKPDSSANTYTYLGFTVTTNPDTAVTDIRMAKFQSTTRAVMYGTAKYTAAGFDAHDNSICYSKDPSVGSAILAGSLRVVNSFAEGKEGSEPVAYFGGTAYNFDACESERRWNFAKYIFFRQAEQYTSGTEYIAGLFFVSGYDIKRSELVDGSWKLSDYAERLGGKLLGDADLTKGRAWYFLNSRNTSTETYLCYTTTYNPKRAIYDVQFYAGTPRMKNFVTTLTAYTGNKESNYAQTGYGITSVFMQELKELGAHETCHYELNNYDDYSVYSGNSLRYYDHYVDNIIPGVTWQSTTTQPRMLYACGSKQGYEPLKVGDLVLSSGEAPAGFVSVQDLKKPYETAPLNLAYYYHEKSDECAPAYLYINRAAPVRGRFVASVKVATYNPDQKWESAEREANDDFSQDLCYISLLGSSSEVLLNQNLALFSDQAWYNYASEAGYRSRSDADYGDDSVFGALQYNSRAAYLGVTYTDNPAKALHGIIRLKAQDGVKPTETMTVNGAKYSLVQNVTAQDPVPVYSPTMQAYYLYATTSSGGSSTGDPITEINVSDKIFEPGMSTVLTVTKGDTAAKKDFYGNVTEAAQYALPYGDSNDSLYLHVKTNTSLTGIDSFFVGTGDTEDAAMADLLTQGATCCLPLNLNKGASTEACVLIGYHLYNPDYVNTKRTKYYMESAVKDLFVYVGSDPQKRLTIDKRKYTLCSDRDLNYGTGGTPMYLYQTTALINDKDKQNASYITAVSAAQFDRVPSDIAEIKWENLLTTENKRINMNEGLNAGVRGFDPTDDEQHLVDSRLYVFVHRNDNYVKPEAVITGGYSTDTTTFGDVVLNKN